MRPDGSFADIPDEIRRRVRDGERVALLLLDALGLRFLHRHDDHPLLERLQVTPLRSQFPSTTTAHVTTVHSGLAVEDHGLYEWNVLEPELDTIICPLRFNFASSKVSDDLEGRLDPAALLPGPTLYETLDAPCFVLQPTAIADSAYTRLATRGAQVHGFETPSGGLRVLADLMAGRDGPAYAFLYWDAIDRAGHESGPDSPAFDEAARAALDAILEQLEDLRDVTVLLTADHGQVAVSPDRVDYLDDLWPELPAMLSQPRPAGSSRDAFLHVRPEHVDTVLAELPARLGDGVAGATAGGAGVAGARVVRAAELFDRIGPRLAARLGQVAVLAAPGRQVWLRSATANERWFRGQHGGLDPAETETYLAEVRHGHA
jgi:predicted AlkP superfamily pyrophosphatase or phosphodiesterase